VATDSAGWRGWLRNSLRFHALTIRRLERRAAAAAYIGDLKRAADRLAKAHAAAAAVYEAALCEMADDAQEVLDAH
jgi:hypothetical protein